MSYDGPEYTFITTTGTPKQSRQQTFNVLSHVVKKHRKWVKNKRLDALIQDYRQGPARRLVEPILQRRFVPQYGNDSSPSSVEHATSSNAITITQDSSHLGALIGHGQDCQCASCLNEALACMFNDHIPSPKLFAGNSDPFSASAVPLIAEVNEYLRHYSSFYVLWAWPVSQSATFRKQAKGDWEESVRACLGKPSEMHAMLAGGAFVRADRAPDGGQRDFFRATSHKMKAMSELRQGLVNKDAKDSAKLLWTMLRLLSVEYYIGNFQAAQWHHGAAKQIIRYHKFPDWHHDSDLAFYTAETAICTALLQKPARMMKDWERNLKFVEIASLPTTSQLRLAHSMTIDVHSAVPSNLRSIFQDINNVLALMEMLPEVSEEDKQFTMVVCLDSRAAIIKGKLLTLWYDFNSSRHRSPDAADGIIYSSTLLAALLFVSFIFMFTSLPALSSTDQVENLRPRTPTRVLDRAYQALGRDLKQILAVWALSTDTVDNELTLWLCFTYVIICEACSVPNITVEVRSVISAALHHLNIKSSPQAICLLRRFLFQESLMKDYVEYMISDSDRPDAPRPRFRQLDAYGKT